jgi:uncharacterized membrane protein
MQDKNEKTIYELFKISIWIKILGSLGEMIIGLASAFISSAFVLRVALYFSQGSTDDADDFIARGLMSAAHAFSASNALFIGIYLFIRGLVQLLLAIALLRNKIWAYPLLLLVLLILVVTQTYAIYFSHSILTGVITVVDIITIYLVGHEYNIVRSIRKQIDSVDV